MTKYFQTSLTFVSRDKTYLGGATLIGQRCSANMEMEREIVFVWDKHASLLLRIVIECERKVL
jgi:hypothetical protein